LSEKIFKKIFIIGIGLIGGSFLKAAKKAQIAERYFAYDDDISSLKSAIDENLIDNILTFEDDFEDIDLIVIATPLSTYKEIFNQLAKSSLKNSLIIDLGSLKNIDSIIPTLFKENFIACHPIAGSEKSGFKNSRSELFSNKKFVICSNQKLIKESEKYQNNLNKLKQICEKIGCKIEMIESRKHDQIFALTSHLPQFLSFLTAEFSIKKPNHELTKKIFRLDSSAEIIWRDIFKMNEKNLENYYSEFFDNLDLIIEEKIKDVNSIKNEAENLIKLIESNFEQKKFHSEFFNNFISKNDHLDQLIEENFVSIFFRFLVVLSYLNIQDIAEFLNYAASGFRDFTSIIYLSEKILKREDLIKKNHQNLAKILSNFK
jgi:prephenate dehydrogenase